MSKTTELKQRLYKKHEQAILENALEYLEKASQLEQDGKKEDAEIVMQDMMDWLNSTLQEIEKKVSSKESVLVDRSILPQEGETVGIGNKVRLGVIKQNEKEEYLSVVTEYYPVKTLIEEEELREKIWSEFFEDSSFTCSIYDKETDKYVGYCSVKNMEDQVWELAIELKPEACHKGYGTEALKMLIQTMYRLTGKRFYSARVEVDNHASQGLMRKLGATPNGVREFLLYGDAIEKFQEENKDSITEEIRAVAAEFCMEAEDILGYVLDYRFDAKKLSEI